MTDVVMTLRRFALLFLVVATTAIASFLMSEVMSANGWSVLAVVVLVLFTFSFTWLAQSFWTAVMGFVARLIGGDPASLAVAVDPSRPLTQRTALLMPIYNEDTDRVVAGLEATVAGLARLPERDHFDVFVLSDTTDPVIAAREGRAIHALALRDNRQGIRIFYRRRARNIGRKAGNLADFVERWGAGYAHVIVLDADSVMSGTTLVALARLMEQHPEAGIIQTIPMPVNRETPFARILQFAARLYGPVMASGLAFWAGGEANYYGHNAIIRTAAFAGHCGLPILPGKAPLGGEILSHDFVEAALIRRHGYRVWIVPELGGSYEEMPANIIDYAKRDRRWCQGNMQHARVLTMGGLRAMSRLHLGMGVFAYIASPIWLAQLGFASVDILDRAIVGPIYFKAGHGLFPDWPIAKTAEIDALIYLTLVALFTPRLMGLALILFSRQRRKAYGGLRALLVSVVGEVLFSALLAPIMMLFQSLFVASTLAGHTVSWNAQPRDDRGLTWTEAFKRHIGHTLIGLTWGGLILAIAPDFFWWVTPVIAGLVISIPLSVLSSRASLGIALKRFGLFLTPDETKPPAELRRLRRIIARGPLHVAPDPLSADEAAALAPVENGLAMPHLPWPSRRGFRSRSLQAAG